MTEISSVEGVYIYGVTSQEGRGFFRKLQDYFIDRKGVSITEKASFFNLLAVMMEAGIPVTRSMQILAKKTSDPRFTRILQTLAYDVERGVVLSKSMLKFPEVFKGSEIGIVRSGESIGRLPELLYKLARKSEKHYNLTLKLRSAMLYPLTVLFALIVSGLIAIEYVIPRMQSFFTQSGGDLPFLTKFVIGVGGFFGEYTMFIFFLCVFVILFFSIYFRSKNGRENLDHFLLSTFYFGDIIQKLNVSQFVQILSLLISSGVPINAAISITGEALENRVYQGHMKILREGVERGEKISDILALAPNLFPETVVSMIFVGEQTGKLGQVAEKLGIHYEEEVEHSLLKAVILLEPFVILLVGLAVGIMAFALLGPLFSLSSLSV